MITISQLELAILAYIKEVLAVQATGVNKFLLYTFVGLQGISIENLLSQYMPILIQLGIMSKDKKINIDNLLQGMHSAFKETKTVEIFNIVFNEEDLNKLEEYIRKVG